MHHDARERRVSAAAVETVLLDRIRKLKSLTDSPSGVRTHNLPERPADIQDDGEFHFAVLCPSAGSDPGQPSKEACRFIEEVTGPDKPRAKNRNAVVLAVPSRSGLEAARAAIRDTLGWEEVADQLKGQDLDLVRATRLAVEREGAQKKIPAAIQQAYCLAATLSAAGDVQAIKVAVEAGALFNHIMADERCRIQETPVSAEALLPEGPYDLWREGEKARYVKDLVGAFAQFAHLPKMLNRTAILDTLVAGCRDGLFVMRLLRPCVFRSKTITRFGPCRSPISLDADHLFR